MNKLWNWGIGLLVVLLIAFLIVISSVGSKETETIKIGIVTDLTGPAAYWGESTKAGIDLAKVELKKEGYNVEFIFEDYHLDAGKALSAVQKLLDADNIDAVYAEFNPAAVAIGSFMADKEKLFVYDAAVVSPLTGSTNIYKTYLDYTEGCKQVAQKFKDENFDKIGVLKVNLEFGDLCVSGVKEIYPAVSIQNYNLGDQDFEPQILKMTQEGITAIINVGFENDTINTLKVIKEQNLNLKYGTVKDTITPQVVDIYSKELEGSYSFGFSNIAADFLKQLEPYNLSSEYGAAIGYTHIKQMVKAIAFCNKDLTCIKEQMDHSKEDNTIGFKKFEDHVAVLSLEIKRG